MKKKEKQKKTKEAELIKDVNEDTNVVKKFVVILILVAALSCLLYFLTAKYLVKDDFQNKESTSEVTITYDTVNVGNIFNRPYDDYYVLAYSSDGDDASYFDNLFSTYSSESNSKKIYKLDLSLKVNKKYLSDTSNKKASNPSELKLKDPSLIEIKSGKISKYYDSKESIEKIIE